MPKISIITLIISDIYFWNSFITITQFLYIIYNVNTVEEVRMTKP